jgi:small subunit ribosomal protein S7
VRINKSNKMRKQKAKKRYLAPDPVYGDPLVTRFVNNLMIGGKKSTAYTSFYEAMERIKNLPMKKVTISGEKQWITQCLR